MNTPNGYAQINALFGNPANDNGSLNHAWYAANIISVPPPAGWQLYYQDSAGVAPAPVSSIQMHRLLKDIFQTVLQQVWYYAAQEAGTTPTDDDIRSWIHQNRLDLTAGGFNFRPNTSNKTVLSMHSYGIAIDWDAVNNPRKKPLTCTLPDWWYNIWAQNGWSDGRHFATPDPMHVQFATGA